MQNYTTEQGYCQIFYEELKEVQIKIIAYS